MIRAITIEHKNLGQCRVTGECAYMQHVEGFDPCSLYVIHDGQLKEVSRNMFEAEALALYDKFCEETTKAAQDTPEQSPA